MGLSRRMFVPRSARRAVRPVRTVKRAVTPKPIKKVQRAVHPVDNAVYGLQRSLDTKPRPATGSPRYQHGPCPVNHQTSAAAAKCRNRRENLLYERLAIPNDAQAADDAAK